MEKRSYDIVDMHMHAGFASHPAKLLHDLDGMCIACFSNTVTPHGYAKAIGSYADIPNVRVGLGLHPWQIGSPELGPLDEALDAFSAQLDTTRFVGETGLDFWPSHSDTKEEQIEALAFIAGSCAEKGGMLVSLHSVKAERELLDVLEASGCLRNCTCILHSYGGSSDQLARAVDDSLLFSIGRRMLSTKRGREYARILPAERILVESDMPSSKDDPSNARALAEDLAWVMDELASMRNAEPQQLKEAISVRSAALLGI